MKNNHAISGLKISTKSLATVSLLCAISIILARVLGIIVPIAGLPALKLNFALLPLIIAGIYFGPAAGFFCGMVADILGYIINPQGGAFFPGFTLTTALSGAIPGIIEKYINKIKHLKIINSLFVFLLSCGFFTVLFIKKSLYINNAILYYGDKPINVVLIILTAIILLAYILLPFIINKLFAQKYKDVDRIYFIVTVTYVITSLLLNTFFLSYYFGKGFLVFLPARILTSYIMIPLNTILVLIITRTLRLNRGEKTDVQK
ncbi:MAG: folate family ECF transporter S component [Eubacteriaceae bacterium]|nr:folate family ECF transporter S component [Eubacteriaceae bacterium]